MMRDQRVYRGLSGHGRREGGYVSAALDIEGLTAGYDRTVSSLRDLDRTCEPADSGRDRPNGHGKTTMLITIPGLIERR